MLTLRGSGSSGCKRAATTPRLRNKNDEEELGDNTALPTLRFRLLQRQYSRDRDTQPASSEEICQRTWASNSLQKQPVLGVWADWYLQKGCWQGEHGLMVQLESVYAKVTGVPGSIIKMETFKLEGKYFPTAITLRSHSGVLY